MQESWVEVVSDNNFLKKPREDRGERDWSKVCKVMGGRYFGNWFNEGGLPLTGDLRGGEGFIEKDG